MDYICAYIYKYDSSNTTLAFASKLRAVRKRSETSQLSTWTVALLEIQAQTVQSVQPSKKSPTGPTERTPKPEYLIALATYLGVRW